MLGEGQLTLLMEWPLVAKPPFRAGPISKRVGSLKLIWIGEKIKTIQSWVDKEDKMVRKWVDYDKSKLYDTIKYLTQILLKQ